MTVFEQSTVVGGVWKYTEDVEDDLVGLDPNRERVHSSLCVSRTLRCALVLPGALHSL